MLRLEQVSLSMRQVQAMDSMTPGEFKDYVNKEFFDKLPAVDRDPEMLWVLLEDFAKAEFAKAYNQYRSKKSRKGGKN